MERCGYSLDAVPNNVLADPQDIQPSFQTIRDEAMDAGGVDPLFLRFRVVELEQLTGRVLGIPAQNAGFREAVEITNSLLQDGRTSHFRLEPVGLLQ